MGIEFWDDIIPIREQLEKVLTIIYTEINVSSPGIRDTLVHIMRSGGKLLRPGFFLISSGFGNIDETKKLNMAAAVELLHMATLIHDDIIDDSDERRGSPTVHSVHGRKKAVLTGDFLFTRCFALVSEYAGKENIKLISDTLSEICNSELIQSSALFDRSSTFLEYMRKIRGKTAALFSLCFYLGAFEGGCDGVILRRLKYAGYYTGVAFQLIDDLLDYETGITGKPAFKDIKEGNYTLPIIYALKTSFGTMNKLLDKKKYSDRDLKLIYEILKDAGGIKKTRQLAEKYSDKALKEMEMIPDNQSKMYLKKMIGKLLNRKY